MTVAVVFSGQGHQHAAMLPWLGDGPLLRHLNELLGVPDWRAACADAAWAGRNGVAQLLLTGTALAAWAELAPRLPPPVAMAGYSVGEIAAFCAAGVYDAATALDLARRRASAMDRCGDAEPGGLLAVVGLPLDAIDALCAGSGAALAIRNGPDSVVVGGPHASLDRLEQRAAAQGARTTRLGVGIASHTRWMADAVERFGAVLRDVSLRRPRVPLFGNAFGRVAGAEDAARALAAQIGRTVQWQDCMDDLRARGPACVLEVGPGQALARLWSQRHPDVPARSCDEFRSAAAIERWVLAQG